MSNRRLPIVIAAALAFAALATSPARADAIDGDWCKPDSSKRMSIRGADILTPGGHQIKGNYSRHAFDYVVPADEPGTGEMVEMILRGEYLVSIRQGGDKAPWEDWRRCSATTS